MGENRRFRFSKRLLSFAMVIMLIFTMIPIDKVYAADVGIGTDGNTVDLSLWNYTANGDTYSLYEYKGSIVDGKIVGCVPTNINGKPVIVMTRTFTPCQSLTQAPKLPNGVIELNNTFVNCIGLTQAPEIPNSVKIMSGTFMGCTGLTQAPIIPDNVTNISGAFNRCTGMTKAPKIPNSITKMFMAFFGCTGLTEAPEIPNNVIDIRMTFSGCTGLTKAPLIPSSVTDMTSTFYGCTNLTGNVFVPEKVTALTDVFSDTTKPITMIYSSNNTVAASYVAPANVTKVVDSLSPQISSVTIGNTSNVTINAIDNYQSLSYAITNTDTAPTSGWQSSNVFSITSDGIYYAWAIDGVGKISASKAFAYPKALDTDGNIVDMSLWTYTANGDTYSLNGYKGSILDGKIVGSVPAVINDKPVTAMSNTFKGCTVLTQAPKLPNSVLNMSGTFEGCTGLTQAPETPSSVTNMEYAFSGCKALTQAPQLPAGVTNMRYTFNNCTALTQAPVLPSTVTTINHTFSGCSALTQTPEIPAGVTDMNAAFSKCTKLTQTPQIPDSVIDMSYAFYMCTGLTSVPVIPNGIKNMSYTFYGCTKLTGNLFIPNSVIKMSYVFTNTAMPITMIYSSNNTVAASTVVPSNVTKAVDSASPEISSVTELDGTITVNATDDYSVEKYALTTSSTVPSTGWQTSNEFTNMPDGRYYAWAMDRVGNVSACKAFAFPQAIAVGTDGNTVDLLLWDFTDNGDTYSLDGYAGSIIDGKIVGSVPATINGKPVTVMSNTFKGCIGLIQAPELPNSVTNISGIFEGCIGLTQAPQISNGVTNMESAFSGCKGLTQAPQIPASVINMRYTFNNCTALTQAPVLPISVTTINHTFSGCSALTQAPKIPNGVTDMNAAFSKCTKLTQTPQIPDSVIDMSYAFYMCTGLTQMPVISNSVTDMKYTFSGCINLTGGILIPKSAIRITSIFANTVMPITMIYSSNNTLAASAVVPSNVTKAVDSDMPEITSVTESDGTIVINATDNYSVAKYAITTSNTAPSTGWQTSKEFANMTDGRYYAWAMDSVGNVSAGKAFMYPQAVSVDVAIGTDGNTVDLSLWDFTGKGETYSLDSYAGSILDGKILGSVPTTINGKPVTAMLNTFKNCTGLIQAPELPNSVTNISGIFEGCIGLTQAPQIPNGVTIMEYAFSGCKSLTQVPQLPAGVINIRYTFNNCTALTQAPVLPSSVTTINHTFSGCSALTQAPKIPNGVTDMNAAFSKCTKLTQTPQIPYSVIDMSYAFYMCTGLTQMPVIPNSVTDMKYTFSGCTSLTGNIFIPKSVIRMSNVFTNTAMPITMIYSADNTTASSYTAPANITKVIDTQDVTNIAVSVDDTTVDEAGGTATFTVNLSETFSSDITVYYVTSDNTATLGDYTSTSGILTIPAGSKTANITVPVTNDTDYEKSESFYLNLTNASLGVITDNQGEGIINDNDSPPAVSLSVSDSSFSEKGGTSTITATLSNKSYQDVTVNLDYSGTAIIGTDYITSGSAIVIPAGCLSNSITLAAIDNMVYTGDKTVILAISSVENGIEEGTQQQTITIKENDTSSHLSSLEISSGALTPAFVPATLDYTVPKVPYSTTNVVVSAVAVDPTSTIKVNGVVMTSGQSTVNLNVGVNTINVLVTALDGETTKNYTITVVRVASSYLSGLSAQVGGANMAWTELMPTPFIKTTTSYTFNEGFDAENIKITPTPEESDAIVEIRVNDSSVGSEALTALKVGQNTVTVTVTAAGGTLVTTYTLCITRAGSTYLSAISCTRGPATPEISKNPPYNYTLKAGITAATTTITLTAEDAISTTITLQVDANTYSSTNGTLVVPSVPTASNPGRIVTATVSSSTGVPSTVYTISVVRVNPAKVITAFNLNGLTPKVIGTVNEASKTIALTVPYGTDLTELVPTITHTGASISPNTGVVQNFTNPIEYTVTAADSSTQKYIVTVTVAANEYTLTYTTGTGGTITGTATQTVSSGANGSAVTATPNSGYHFVGWSDGVTTATRTDSNVTGNITVTANFAKDTNTSSPADSVVTPIPVVDIFINNEKINYATSEIKLEDGKKKTTIKLDDEKLTIKLNKENEGSVITIPVNNNSDIVIGQLNGQTVKNMQNKKATLEIKTENVIYTIPAEDINIDSVSEKIGSQVQLKDIKVNIIVSSSSKETITKVENSARSKNLQLVVQPVDFEITCTNGSRIVDVSKFNNYVERTVILPEGIDNKKVTTGVVFNEDGTFSHVPTAVYQDKIDGKYHAKINSLTNSTYAVIWNPVTFNDVENHWSKDYVKDVGSRLIDDGVGNGNFAPNRAITRAEFASMVVKALGLKGTNFAEKFGDVKKGDDYNYYIYTAYEYGILANYSNGNFGPQDLITREEAMTMLAKVMEIAGMNVTVSDTDVSNQLKLFKDSDNISVYARQAISVCIKNGIFAAGNEVRLTPKDNFTRAESATVIIKLLKKSELI